MFITKKSFFSSHINNMHIGNCLQKEKFSLLEPFPRRKFPLTMSRVGTFGKPRPLLSLNFVPCIKNVYELELETKENIIFYYVLLLVIHIMRGGGSIIF